MMKVKCRNIKDTAIKSRRETATFYNIEFKIILFVKKLFPDRTYFKARPIKNIKTEKKRSILKNKKNYGTFVKNSHINSKS
jgi:hypothetical protein